MRQYANIVFLYRRGDKMKITLPDGKTVEAHSLDFKTNKEEWNEYQLEDGTTLKVKAIVIGIIRADSWNPITGDPFYRTESKLITRTLVPDKLKKTITIKKDERLDVA